MTEFKRKFWFPRTGTLVLIGFAMLIAGGVLMALLPDHREQQAIAEIGNHLAAHRALPGRPKFPALFEIGDLRFNSGNSGRRIASSVIFPLYPSVIFDRSMEVPDSSMKFDAALLLTRHRNLSEFPGCCDFQGP